MLAARGRTVRWALRRPRPPLTPGPLYSAPPRDDAAGEAARPEAACSHGRLGFEPQSTSLSLARAEFPKVTGAACTCRKPRPVCRARSSPLAEPVGCR